MNRRQNHTFDLDPLAAGNQLAGGYLGYRKAVNRLTLRHLSAGAVVEH
jgi:hypothetical protein